VDYLWVALGGGLGALARYSVSAWIIGRFGTDFPFATFLINVTGSFAIGVLLTVLTERLTVDPAYRLFVVVGFLGGYTTFSTYSFEALALMAGGAPLRAGLYILLSNVMSLGFAFLGIVLARRLGS
jgi:fluoride exporter